MALVLPRTIRTTRREGKAFRMGGSDRTLAVSLKKSINRGRNVTIPDLFLKKMIRFEGC